MTPPRTGQRSRSELIAELYERHAAGLFAYCHDQLGETASAADAVVAVFTTIPTEEPPSRAALYALARREIYRRDVSYALPAVDSVVDPATALIERVYRDIRPHQREVLLLSQVCGLTAPELSLVLDVAADTAEELIAGATRRFAQTLETAVAAARSAPFVPTSVAEVYDAIGVSPLGDVLARLPWRRPSASVRNRVLSALPYEEPGSAATDREQPSGLVTKKLWPTTPTWPLPLTDPDQVTNTCVVKADAIGQPQGSGRKAKHEATTEPMPRLRGALLGSLGEGRLRRKRAGKSAPAKRPAALAAPTQVPAAAEEATGPAPVTPPAPGRAETETFDAFGASETLRRADPFDALGTSAAARRTFDAFGKPGAPADPLAPASPRTEPFDAFATAPRQPDTTSAPHTEPFDAFGKPGTSAAPSPQTFDAFATAPRQPDTTGTPHTEPFDAFGKPGVAADPLAAASRPGDLLDALFNTLRFAEPFDAFRTAESAGTSRQAESGVPQPGPFEPVSATGQTHAFPRVFTDDEEPSGGFPAPVAEPPLPAASFVDALAPVPRETGRPAESFRTAEVTGVPQPTGTDDKDDKGAPDGESAAEVTTTEPYASVHPAAAALSAPRPAAPRRTDRRRTGSKASRKRSGKPSGDGAGRSRRVKSERHYDWLWEIVGILICLIIALIVFFNVPTVFTP